MSKRRTEPSAKERRRTLYVMSGLRRGISRPDSVGRDLDFMEALAETGHVNRLDNPHVPIFQITERGRQEVRDLESTERQMRDERTEI